MHGQEYSKLERVKEGKKEELSSNVPSDLDEVLVNFYAELRKVDGQEYERACLRVMRSSLDRYLKEKNYPVSIISSDEFKESNKVLEGKARDLRDKGMGNRPNLSLPLTTQEEEVLWQCGQLGNENAQSLIINLWWLMTQHFGLRGRQEHHPLMLETIKVHTGDDGERYYILSENRTKTRQGGLTKKDRESSPKLFEIGGPRCFYVLLDIFKSKRPANFRDKGPFYLQIIENPRARNPKLFEVGGPRCFFVLLDIFKSKRPAHLRDEGPFYLQIIGNPRTVQWYKNLRMGENTVGDIMKNMKTNSPLAANEKMTNHSARKTAVNCKKMQRKDSYDEGDERQQKTLSNIIDGITPNSRPSQGCFTANHQSPSALTAPARRPPLQEISVNVLQPRPRYYQAPASYPAFQQFQQHQQALRESYRPIINVQSQHDMYYPPSNIVYHPPAPIQQVVNVSNSTVTFNQNELQNEAKRQRTCTSAEPIDADAEIGLDFTLFSELLD